MSERQHHMLTNAEIAQILERRHKKLAKTYKREVSVFMLSFLFALCGYYVHTGSEHAHEMIELFFYPVITFTGIAFGFDAVAKQILKDKAGIERDKK